MHFLPIIQAGLSFANIRRSCFSSLKMAQEKFQEYNSHTFSFMKNILIVLADGIRVSGDRIRLLADAIRMRTEREENVGKGRGNVWRE